MISRPHVYIAILLHLATWTLGCAGEPVLEKFCNTTRAEIEGTYTVTLSCQPVDSTCYLDCSQADSPDVNCSANTDCLGEATEYKALVGLSQPSHIESLNNSDITHWLWADVFVSEGAQWIDHPATGGKCDTDSGGDATPNVLAFNLAGVQGTSCSVDIHALNSGKETQLGTPVACEWKAPTHDETPSHYCEVVVTKSNETPPSELEKEVDPSWTSMSQRDGFFDPPLTINAIWVENNTSAFAAGELGTILHYDGKTWKMMRTGVLTNLRAVWGSAVTNVYAAGSMGRILHFDGNEWTKVSGPESMSELSEFEGEPIHALWGASANEIYAVGTSISYFDGETWEKLDVDFSGVLTGVWGSSGQDVYVVGEKGLWHFDGADWSSMPSPVPAPTSISGTGSDNIFISGWWGGLAHYDGTQWSRIETVTSQTLDSVWAAGDDEAFAVGSWPGEYAASRIVHYTLDATSATTAPSALSAIYGSQESIFAAGDNLTLLELER